MMALSELQISKLVERYSRERDRYVKMAETVSRRLSAALHDAAVAHLPTFRAKSPDSLRGKLRRDRYDYSEKSFEPELGPALLDLAGVRILLYRPDDAGIVCETAEELFEVPDGPRFRKEHSNELGYRARHRVVQLDSDVIGGDSSLGNLTGVHCEIQVVTLGDHIWNELEHDIKYKTPDGEPSELQKGLLRALRCELNSVGDAVDQLMRATDARREENLTLIESPEDLLIALRACTGRTFRGDLARVLELLTQALPPLNSAVLQTRLKGADLDESFAELERHGLVDRADDPLLVIDAMWEVHGEDFAEIVRSWLGKPGPFARGVRALAKKRLDG